MRLQPASGKLPIPESMRPVRFLALTLGLIVIVLPGSLSQGKEKTSPSKRKLNLPEKPYAYAQPKFPVNFEPRWNEALDTTPDDNPTTDAGATLGRVLFYETRLSGGQTVSCGSCHLQQHSFAEPRRTSVGHEGRAGDRNSMSLVNLRFSRAGFFWDERAETLEEAVQLPVRSRIEMAGPHGVRAAEAIAHDPQYRPLFEQAFGTEKITDERIYKALSQFIRSLVSCDSKYDRAAAKENSFEDAFAGFTAEENRGKELFVEHCKLCHHIGEGKHVAVFAMFRSLGNAIDEPDAADGGCGDITLNPSEVGLFKASSLRNIEVTAPYMHDGRFATLGEVIDHYSKGVKRHPNTGRVPRLNLSDQDKGALVAFLKSLTDHTFLNDPRFSDPWYGQSTSTSELQPIEGSQHQASPVQRVADRLTAGTGLEVGEALPWLLQLDKNSDGLLDESEREPLVDILVRTRDARLSDGRPLRREGSRRGEKPTEASGDFNSDGRVEANEARVYSIFKRLVELGDGSPLRRSVRIDRFLSAFELSAEEARVARSVLDRSRRDLASKSQELDQQFMQRFEQATSPEAVVRFQTIVIDRQLGVNQQPRALDRLRKQILEQIAAFDQSEDGQLSQEEIKALAVALDRLPGGFGQASPPPIDMEQFTKRFTSFDPEGKGAVTVAKIPERLASLAAKGDSNEDGVLSSEELQNYIRQTAFGNLLDEGIYVGGGFANTLTRHAETFNELELPAEQQKAVNALLAEHTQKLKQLRATELTQLFEAFREAVGHKTPRLALR